MGLFLHPQHGERTGGGAPQLGGAQFPPLGMWKRDSLEVPTIPFAGPGPRGWDARTARSGGGSPQRERQDRNLRAAPRALVLPPFPSNCTGHRRSLAGRGEPDACPLLPSRSTSVMNTDTSKGPHPRVKAKTFLLAPGFLPIPYIATVVAGSVVRNTQKPGMVLGS